MVRANRAVARGAAGRPLYTRIWTRRVRIIAQGGTVEDAGCDCPHAGYLRAAAISVALARHPTSEAKRHVQRQRRLLPWPRREDRTYEPVAADRAATDHAVGAARRAAHPRQPQRPLSAGRPRPPSHRQQASHRATAWRAGDSVTRSAVRTDWRGTPRDPHLPAAQNRAGATRLRAPGRPLRIHRRQS
jgi:hypothetical protein